jgi:peroxiredoxin
MIRSILFLFILVATGTAFSPLPKASVVRSSTTALNMADVVKAGDRIPSIVLQEGQADYGKPEAVNIADLIAGKKVAIFAVPGAFTPGCSKSHLPSFITAQDELKAKGIALTICIATNDAYVMEVSQHKLFPITTISYIRSEYSEYNIVSLFIYQAWGRTSGGADAGIRFLSDSNAELSRALGLAIESPVMVRTKRFSLIAEDGVVTHYFSSDKESSDTWAPTVLAAL